MDDHKKQKRPQRKVASIDGIVSGRPQLGSSPRLPRQQTDAETTTELGDYSNRVDGFQPMRQSPGGVGLAPEDAETAALLDEPIILDDNVDTSKKRGKRKMPVAHRHSRRRKVIKRSLLALAILILAGAGYIGYKYYDTQKQVLAGGGQAATLCNSNVDVNQLQTEGDSRVNILLLGIGGANHDGSDLTDTIMIASIDPINHSAILLSIPRDLWVKIPGNGYQKINAAYAYGKQNSKANTLVGKEKDGIELLDKTLEPVIGIPIHYHALFDFTAFKDIVNDLGGVTLDVPSSALNYPASAPTVLDDPTIAWENNNNRVIAQKGVQTFNGQKALLFAKSRETSSDFARGERQRLLLVAIKDKTLSIGTFSNPVKVVQLLNSLGNNVYTDFNNGSIKCLYKQANQISSSNIKSLDLVTPPHNLLTTANVNGLSVVKPRAGTFDYSAVQNYLRTTLRDSYLAKENASVAVYNATSVVGVATAQSNLLKSYGYNVTKADSTPAPTNPTTTTIVDLTKGVDKYTKHYLEKRYGVTSTSKMPSQLGITPPTGTNFVIIIGEDVANSG
jgi:LCP family protein required for cell wall assembly